ncbi:hypothetical protein LSAT2_029271 [Lamellibrachia satsuma]|nr:hypothetical protein LSAT2_029271 [Lamellibrachia satsuma]
MAFAATLGLLVLLVVCTVVVAKPDGPAEDIEVDEKAVDYAKGSLCGYCRYCTFCELCDKDCPCEKSPSRPNCHMCKYCKYCFACKVCDKVCQPGGILDRVTSKIVNSLTSVEAPPKDEVEKDLASVKKWVDAKEEL